MLKLRKILLSNYLYYVMLFIVILLSLIRIIIPKQSIYNSKETTFDLIITKITVDGNKLIVNLKGEESLIGTYYFETKKERNSFINNIHLGDTLRIIGILTKPKENTTKYLFNYKKYLLTKNINYLLTITSYQKIKSTNNLFYIMKQKIINYFDNSPYLNAFILGDKSYISNDIIKSYQENSISHLFAISGMHITLLSSLILKILRKVLSEEKSYLITSIILIIYLQLVGLSPSILRGVLFFILFSINKIYYLNIKSLNIFIITLSITLIINSLYIFDIGFQFSYLISFSLLYFSNYLKGNYLISLLKVSLVSFLVSIPITLMNFYQINILSIIYNLIYVPFISVIIFPFTLIVSLFKFLLPVYDLLIFILEQTSLLLSKISIFKLIFYRLPFPVYIIYLVLIFISLKKLTKNNYKPLILLLIILFLHYLYPSITRGEYLAMLDVGQGDSLILSSNNETILIDTGGKTSYEESWQKKIKNTNYADTTIIPALKSLGVKKLKYLILTHGDSDHLGDALSLIENFKVETIILNQGNVNYLEEQIIKKHKNVIFSKELSQISVGDIRLVELNTTYSNENDSSQVYLANYKNINILLTGDASIETEKLILDKYNLPQIDILKVGHHGSKTSTSKELINSINPKYAIISCGLDNKFKHPHQEVLDKLSNSYIYRTDLNGSIMFKLNNKVKVET